MQKPRPTDNEAERLSALKELDILDSEAEASYDEITRLAAEICGTPISLISLVDSERQWFKSRTGLSASETPREVAFCAHAIHQDGLFEVPDSRKDARFDDNPLVTGNPGVVFYAAAPLCLSEGIRVGTLCVIDHIPKSLTTRQREALDCLARQVVIQLRLRKANRDLARSLKARTAFLASMSHEIRTHLNGILGLATLIDGKPLPEEDRENLSSIRSSGDSLLRIINDILDYTRIESSAVTLEAHDFDLGPLLRHAMELVRPAAAAKGLDLVEEFPALSHLLRGDSSRLTQVLSNLLGNAVKFTPRGRVRLAATVSPADRPEACRLAIEVSDQGIGIPEEALPRLFQPFTQAHAGIRRRFGGTGLGLAIVKNIVEAMGGKISVRSREGEGSTFLIDLELGRAAPVPSRAPEGQGEDSRPLPRPLVVLVAEDDRISRKVLLAFLSRLGCRVVAAENGADAVAQAAEGRFDAILMDCQMPGMDGLEATRLIRNSAAGNARTRILALTAGVLPEERAACLEAGMDEILHKPLDFPALRKALEDLAASAG